MGSSRTGPLVAADAIPGRLEAVLREHVIDAWFPRSLDTEHGGFLTSFDRRWRPYHRQPKLLEFQARHTLFAAEASRVFPDDEVLRTATVHGARWLTEAMWDRAEGGWFHRVDRDGRPLGGGAKHAHGAAYAIEAAISVYETTGDRRWLAHAREGFAWLERACHDDRHGGYFGPTDRAGSPILERPAGGPPLDAIGTPYGWKDTNVTSDLLEAFLHFVRVAPDAEVEERLAEVLDLVSCRMIDHETGGLPYFYRGDWTPVPASHRASVAFQTAWRLYRARGRLGDDRVRALAGGLASWAVEHARDDARGGYYLVDATTPRADPADSAGYGKAWWVQVEAAKAFAAMSRLDPDEARWRSLYAEQVRHLLDRYVDPVHGGLFPVALDSLPAWRRHPRAAPAWATDKGSPWKDASHEGTGILFCAGLARA
jgi:mannobiose 2-epimerase